MFLFLFNNILQAYFLICFKKVSKKALDISAKVVYIGESVILKNGASKMEDEKIVQLYFDRNEQAISETDNKYGNYCNSIARNILGNREDAEECVNHTYLNTWNSIPPHRPKMLSTFLGKIVRNLAFNRYKHNTAEKRGGSEVALVLDELAELISSADDVEKAVEQKELTVLINDFLGGLSSEKRNIFVCRYWYADSVSEIANRFGMTQAAVSMSLQRLRTKLRDYLIIRGYAI